MRSRLVRLGLYALTASTLLVAVLLVWEALYVGLLAGRRALDQYAFGGTAMLEHGGASYVSAGTYLSSVTAMALPAVALAVLLLVLLWARRPLATTGFPWGAWRPSRVLFAAAGVFWLLALSGGIDPRGRQAISLAPAAPAPAHWPYWVATALGLACFGGALAARARTRSVAASAG